MSLQVKADQAGPYFQGEDGGITVLSLFLFILMLCAAGLAVDVNNAMQARAQLQGAADAAGHAALYHRFVNKRIADEGDAIDHGIRVAEANMPRSLFGEVLATADVEFGDWDSVDRTFTVDPGNRTAVRVTARRVSSRGNAVRTFLMKFLGIEELNLNVVSVWDLEDGFCPPRDPDKKRGEGFFARDIVDIQSNNTYFDGFCVHSDTHVEFQNNNFFEDGVTVSMPDWADMIVPDWAEIDNKNPGLTDALASMNQNLDTFFNDLPDLIADYGDPLWPGQPDYITETTVNVVPEMKSKDTLTMTDLQEFAVNKVSCTNGTAKVGDVLKNVVIVTDCALSFQNGAAVENAVVATTSVSNKSISGTSDFRVGATDFCSKGTGGGTILTMGDFSVASDLKAYGANVIADGDISITANAGGLAGINFMAGGRIDATSNGDLGFCNFGPPDVLTIPVFRMVM